MFFECRISYRLLSGCRFFSSLKINKHSGGSGISLNAFLPDKIRNFGIIAHVNHGKSTLADRLMQLTHVITSEEKEQYLDKLQVERERGITVKAQTCTMIHKDLMINLIDTPGHIDFSFEVARSLVACDGVLLLIAANQGIQAQTIANFWLAFEQNQIIIPVINKIDMPNVQIELIENQIINLFDFNKSDILYISAKTGENVPLILDTIIERIPPPNANRDEPFLALIFDSWFDHFRGAIALVLVQKGSISKHMKIQSFNNKKEYEVSEVGIMHPEMMLCETLYAGQVGYVVCNMKTVKEANIGELLFDPTLQSVENIQPFVGFKPIKPTIYAGIFPVDLLEYDNLRQAVERLYLSDPSVTLEPNFSPALGPGWRIGFLGALHMEVFGQRLDQEYDANVILTAPNVEYKAEIIDNESVRKKRYKGQSEIIIGNVSQFPEYVTDIASFYEPMVQLTIVTPNEYLKIVDNLCERIRGERNDCASIDECRLMIKWRLPLAEVISGFFEDLKRETSGYASFDYEKSGYREIELVKISIKINNKLIEEFSQICSKIYALKKARKLVEKLKEEIPRQQYEVEIKAHLGSSTKALAQGTIKPYKKDFTGTLKGNFGGGGMERLNKKLSHQREGKNRMKSIGNVNIPKEAFFNVLKK